MSSSNPPAEPTLVRSVPPSFVMKLLNPLATFLVSRGWTRVGDAVMILRWTGRRSGAAYATPVSRMELDGRVFTTTTATYRHNFVGGGPAELVVDGECRSVTGTMIDDPVAIGSYLRAFLDAEGFSGEGRAFGATITGDPTADDIAAYVAEVGTVVIEFIPA